MNAYAVVGFLIAFGASAVYAAYTVLESRRVAAKVLALQAIRPPSQSHATMTTEAMEASEAS